MANEVINLYTGQGKFKDCDFQKRQAQYKEQSELKKGEEGALSVKEQYNRLKGIDENEQDEKIGKFQSLNQMDELNLTDDIKLQEVFLVTRELEEGNDSYEIYEVYDKDGNILLRTDKDRNIIAEENLKGIFSPEQIKELEEKVLMRMTRTDPETGKRYDSMAVSDKMGEDKDIDDMKDVKDSTTYSDIKEADEKDELNQEEELDEQQIEEKVGGRIIDIIEDPNFYQIIPFAKYKTYLVEESGQYKFIDGRGEEIKGMEELQMDVRVDDRNTENQVEKAQADIVFSTGRNDDDLVIAIKDGKTSVVDRENKNSYQLDTAGYNTTIKEQDKVRDEVTYDDEVAEMLGESNINGQDVIDFLNQECKPMSLKNELYQMCIEKDIKKGDRQAMLEAINEILERDENENERTNEERAREERVKDTEDEKARMKR